MKFKSNNVEKVEEVEEVKNDVQEEPQDTKKSSNGKNEDFFTTLYSELVYLTLLVRKNRNATKVLNKLCCKLAMLLDMEYPNWKFVNTASVDACMSEEEIKEAIKSTYDYVNTFESNKLTFMESYVCSKIVVNLAKLYLNVEEDGNKENCKS